MKDEGRVKEIGKHQISIPENMPFNYEDRINCIRESIETILCSGVYLRSPARVACYSSPAHLVYYLSKNGELKLNTLPLNPDFTLDSSRMVDEKLSKRGLSHILRLVFDPMYRIAVKKMKGGNER